MLNPKGLILVNYVGFLGLLHKLRIWVFNHKAESILRHTGLAHDFNIDTRIGDGENNLL